MGAHGSGDAGARVLSRFRAKGEQLKRVEDFHLMVKARIRPGCVTCAVLAQERTGANPSLVGIVCFRGQKIFVAKRANMLDRQDV